jgi:hypothetical protein
MNGLELRNEEREGEAPAEPVASFSSASAGGPE